MSHTNLKKRKRAAYEAGVRSMTKKRRLNLDDRYEKYDLAPKDSNIRIKARKEKNEQWGLSADENVRTQLLRSQHSKMKKTEREMAYFQRDHQGTLIWKTRSDTLGIYGKRAKTKPKRPLGSHTPGLKSKVVGGNTGALTEEHNTRDRLRVSAVKKTLHDKKRGDIDIAAMSNLASTQLLMSPLEELNTVRSKVTGKNASKTHSVFKSIDDVTQGKNFDKLANTVQETREFKKIHSANLLHHGGYDELIPPEHTQLLQNHNWDPGKALSALRAESTDPQSTFNFNIGTSSQTDPLNQRSLRRMNLRARKGKRVRALSPPRRLPSKTPKNVPWK